MCRIDIVECGPVFASVTDEDVNGFDDGGDLARLAEEVAYQAGRLAVRDRVDVNGVFEEVQKRLPATDELPLSLDSAFDVLFAEGRLRVVGHTVVIVSTERIIKM